MVQSPSLITAPILWLLLLSFDADMDGVVVAGPSLSSGFIVPSDQSGISEPPSLTFHHGFSHIFLNNSLSFNQRVFIFV